MVKIQKLNKHYYLRRVILILLRFVKAQKVQGLFMSHIESLRKIQLDDYVNIVGAEKINSVRTLAEKLKGKSVTHVNSTSFGGEVAEILQNLVPLMKDVGWMFIGR